MSQNKPIEPGRPLTAKECNDRFSQYFRVHNFFGIDEDPLIVAIEEAVIWDEYCRDLEVLREKRQTE